MFILHLLAASFAMGAQAQTAKRPLNVFVVDIASAAPALDAFAKESAVFEQALSPSPWCPAARATLLTGQPPEIHGLYVPSGRLPASLPTLAEKLKDAGFDTAAFVEAGAWPTTWGLERGFDVFEVGASTHAVAAWLQGRTGRRFFLYVQRPAEQGVIDQLKALGRWDDTLAACLKFDLDVDRAGERLGTYAYLKTSEDTTDGTSQRMHGRYVSAASRAAQAASYIRPEILAIPPERMDQFLADKRLAGAAQVHGGRAAVITSPDQAREEDIPAVDILVTTVPGLGLLIKQADCQAVMLYDPVNRVVANVHCGWRGQVLNLLSDTVRLLQSRFGTRPVDLYAAVGPSLGPCCAEFTNFRREFPPDLWTYQVQPAYFDLWRLSRDQMTAAGLLPSRLDLSGLCTRGGAGDFYSYRRDKVTGRQGAIIALKA